MKSRLESPPKTLMTSRNSWFWCGEKRYSWGSAYQIVHRILLKVRYFYLFHGSLSPPYHPSLHLSSQPPLSYLYLPETGIYNAILPATAGSSKREMLSQWMTLVFTTNDARAWEDWVVHFSEWMNQFLLTGTLVYNVYEWANEVIYIRVHWNNYVF